jgi:hypothetical protein
MSLCTETKALHFPILQLSLLDSFADVIYTQKE